MSERLFLDTTVQGGILSKRAKNSAKQAVELGANLTRMVNDGEPHECLEPLRNSLALFFKNIQVKWVR